MAYKLISEELKIATIGVAELTAHQVQCFLSQWEEGAEIGALTLFYDRKNDLIVLNRNCADFDIYLKLAERVLTANESYLQKLENRAPSREIEAIKLLIECRRNRIARVEIDRAMKNIIDNKQYMSVLGELVKIEPSITFDVRIAFKYGLMCGKREERARRKRRNQQQHTDLKQQIAELVGEAPNNESLELIYRFCKKIMQE